MKTLYVDRHNCVCVIRPDGREFSSWVCEREGTFITTGFGTFVHQNGEWVDVIGRGFRLKQTEDDE